MAVTPNYQFYPQKALLLDPFHTTSVFARATLVCQRHGSPFPSKIRIFPRASYSQESPKRSSKGNSAREETSLVSSSTSWLDEWSENQEPISDRELVNYRKESASVSSGGSTMDRIVEKLKKFGYMDDDSDLSSDRVRQNVGGGIQKGYVDDVFNGEQGVSHNTRGSVEMGFPWEKKGMGGQTPTVDSRRSRSMAELTLPESELRRLRNLALRIKNKTRITGGGVTQQVVDAIQDKWRTCEVCRLKVEGAAALNMKRIHEILERRTGGLVIWRSGTSVTLYRGVTYEDPEKKLKRSTLRGNEVSQEASLAGHDSSSPQTEPTSINPDHMNMETLPEVKYEDEIDELLDSLGPRYTDWPGDGPLPVDADLLPGVIANYKPPFRLLPYGVRSTVGMKEGTALRRLARTLPPHFALGRSRQHQGLAAAMVKLWERSSIAKIALKRGVQLTTSERMAEDIKILTGGMLLSRDKDSLVFYRGKDFLTPDVAEALLEKERLAKSFENEEEQARLRASAFLTPSIVRVDEPGMAGTLKETLDADSKWGKRFDDSYKQKVMREADVLRHAELVRKLENKLKLAERKVKRAGRALSKVEESLYPADHEDDPESLSDEERFMFRKLGLRMKAFLLLGRRGIFGGTVENMHLHWKYRELVKIIVKANDIEEVKNIALSLEAESGGVLVSVDKVSKGYAIIVFRGRDYERPSLLRPKNLLTKRKALARSIELQRQQAILSHISTMEKRVNQLRSELEQMAALKDQGSEELYNHLDSAYPSEDEDSDIAEDEDTEGDAGMYFEKYTEDKEVEENDSTQTGYLDNKIVVSDLQKESETELAEPYY